MVILLLVLSASSLPVIAAGNGGSFGSDGEGGGSGGNGSDQAGNSGSGTGPSGPEGPQAQSLAEEQERQQQETVEQPGVRINQQDQDQTQGRTHVDTAAESASADLIRQRDRDLFLQQVSLQEQNFTRDQDRIHATVDVALYAFSLSGNVTGSSGPELARLGTEVNNSQASVFEAERRIQTRNPISRVLFGGDQEAAGQLILVADQNRQRIREMEQLVSNCTDCDPQVQALLEQQLTILSQEQNRITAIGQQEQSEKGLFAWSFGSIFP